MICAGGTLGILIPPSILLIVYAATSGVSVVRMYAAALLPGLFLAGLYLVYVVGKALLQPQLAPKPTRRNRSANIRSSRSSWMMFTSFVPLAFLILAVLGAILFGLGDPVGGRGDRRARRPAARRRLPGADLAAAEGDPSI